MLVTGIAISHAGRLFARVDTRTGMAAVVTYERCNCPNRRGRAKIYRTVILANL
jgi:hypothetical protein